MLPTNLLLQNRYHILRPVGRGGMGAVYAATDQRLGHTVAVKQIVQGDPQGFAHEAKLLAHLNHPALPQVYDHFVEDDQHFLVMEFIPGDDLATARLRRQQPFAVDQVLDWADQLLDVLSYLHSQQPPVIHRDIKPANLKVTERGRLILLDFGLTKGKVGQTSEAQRSAADYTLVYAAPEQIRGDGTDARSDLYSVGATLYDLLTNEPPADVIQRALALADDKPDPLIAAHLRNPAVARLLADVLARAMALKPTERFDNAAALRSALQAVRLADATMIVPTPANQPERVTPPKPVDIPNNLPAQLTPLVGRQTELTAATALLRRAAVRLVTLTGPGGVGKTRLGQEVAAHLLADRAAGAEPLFPDGIFFVPLAAILDPALIAAVIAQPLGVKETGSKPLLRSVEDHLRTRQMLLVLDNFEQLVDAAPLLTDLLMTCPHLKILVTSRELLHLRGEHEFAVPPLSLPTLDRLPPLATLAQVAAVELFLQRAQAIKPDFGLDDVNAAAVAELCVRLDGLPLALELAAARSKLLSPQAMLAQLRNRFKFLRGGARDLPDRQRTLQATIDWSYDLLNPDEQTLFCRLAVFQGGCTLAAAETICIDPTSAIGEFHFADGSPTGQNPNSKIVRLRLTNVQNSLDALTALCDKSLLQQTTGVDGEPRFTLLMTLHEYATGHLSARTETALIQQRHMVYYLKVAEDAKPHLAEADQVQWFDQLAQEHDNLRAALRRALTANEVENGIRFCAALWQFWHRRAYLSEGRQWIEAALVLAAQLPARALPALSNVMRGAGGIIYLQGDYQRATVLYQQSLELCRRLGDQMGIGAALGQLGMIAHYQGEYIEAQAFYTEMLQVNQASGNQRSLASAYSHLGALTKDMGEFHQAKTYWEESLALFRILGDAFYVAGHILNLGELAYLQGDYDRATILTTECLAMSRQNDDTLGVMLALHNLGMVATAQGEFAQATMLLNEAIHLCAELGDDWNRASALRLLGQIAYYQADYQQAAQLCQEGLRLNRELEYKQAIAGCLCDLGRIRLRQGEGAQAVALLHESLALYQAMVDRSGIAACLHGLAEVAYGQGQAIRAIHLLRAVATLRQTHELPVTPVEREQEQQFLLLVRGQLDEITFNAAWAAASSMTIEQVIEDGLQGN